MLKFKIIHKSLLLVGVPLLYGIAFLSLLSYGLSESNRIFQHELLLKDAMITTDVTNRRIFAGRIAAVSYFICKDDYFDKIYYENMREAALAFKHLQKLLKNERGLQYKLDYLKHELVAGNSGFVLIMHSPISTVGLADVFNMFGGIGVDRFFTNTPVYTLMDTLDRLSRRETASALNAMNSVLIILFGGMFLSLLLAGVLTTFFCLNITSRLLLIINNTISLSRGTTLSPPLKGNDEIAELDQFLYKAATDIRELERFKKEMIGVVSHELKSPLSSVEMFLSSFSAGVFGELGDRAKEKVQRIHQSVVRLMGLVKELLYLDRLALDMHAEPISVDSLVTASIDTVRELSEQAGIEIVSRNTAGSIEADRDRLLQVIVNLLSNALKFSPVAGTVTVETRETDGIFECRITDQGRGIPEVFRKEIFEPFQQVDGRDATAKKGTGLGLTISKSIVEQHGGKIGVDSEEGKGSTFWFKIPTSGRQLPSSPELKSSTRELPAGSENYSEAKQSGRFKVLHKGLIIISVPLIFQLCFASVIGVLLHQVREQIHKEEHSKEIVDSMNKMSERLLLASNDGLMYVYSREPEYLKAWQGGKKAGLKLFDRVRELSASDSGQKENIEETSAWLHKTIGLLDKMVALDRDNELGSIENLQAFLKKEGMIEQIKPLFEGQESQENLMERERETGEKLAAQRIKMIKNLKSTLSAGIILNIILATCLAAFLMRNMTSRLQHVMANTGRLLKREELEAPRAGSDEIALLDRVLYETARRLVELEKFKQELISIVSHELRTPLLSVSSGLELFASGAVCDLSAKGQNRLKIAQEETERLIRLINDLLDIEKMEAGKFVLDRSEIRVSDLIESCFAAVTGLADAKSINLQSLPHDPDFKFNADRDRLCQVLINLLSNAIKFSPNGAAIKIESEQIASELELRVIDQGRGIPEELRAKIFDRFVQVEKSDASERGGSGLGLAIARAIVEQHGGSIGVRSELGTGSTFWFRLPLDYVVSG